MSGEHSPSANLQREVALVELLDRALGAGVVVGGDVTLSLADVDLVELHLRLVVGSVPTLRRGPTPERPHELTEPTADGLPDAADGRAEHAPPEPPGATS